MTKEQFKDDILLAMSSIIDQESLGVLRDVLTSRLKSVEFTSDTCEIATIYNWIDVLFGYGLKLILQH